jgi:DNA helicase-2/ATP-dependent DNA helicase PcrA
MRFIADLHIHSHFSRATSRNLDLEHLNLWAQLKGLQVVATGDISHPKWLEEMKAKLEPSAPGLFRLKEEYAQGLQKEVPFSCKSDVHFILSGEISNIYKKDGAVRKVHNVVFMPSLESVARFQTALERIGNIHSDGRPILGLDSRDLLAIVLDCDPDSHLIPAHIWTPWFSMLGSKSGFDSVQACYGDLTSHIFALETGLSSDPAMNWRLSMLDEYVLVSNSDAHSPGNLAREANVFDTELSYPALFAALKNKNGSGFWGTLEFFPEEGKYHMDGHRKCKKMTRPEETMANNGICPVCGSPSVLGVSYRVAELADREEGFKPETAKYFMSLVPLPEVLAEVYGTGPSSKRVQSLYQAMLHGLGPELEILMNISLADIEKVAGPLAAEAIHRVRSGQVTAEPGYDGEYGVIRIFNEEDRKSVLQQGALFALPEVTSKIKVSPPADDLFSAIEREQTPVEPVYDVVKEQTNEYGLNEEQRKAVEHRGSPLIIQAGPGTGKTRTLTHRIAALIKSGFARPWEILAVTFTNKAAQEMRQRLEVLLDPKSAGRVTVLTFHALGAVILRQSEFFYQRNSSFTIIDPEKNAQLKERLHDRSGQRVSAAMLERISHLKGRLFGPDNLPKEIMENLPEKFVPVFSVYEDLLIEQNAVDYDDLIALPVKLLRNKPEWRREFLKRFPIIAVDEFQDINQAQYELFRIFAIAARDVCIIGDPDQAIYGFRGASREFFVRFSEDFPHATCLRLTRNYRSAQNILTASRQMLEAGQKPRDEELWSHIAPEVKIHLHQAVSDRAEAEFVVTQIEQLMGGTSHYALDTRRVQSGSPSQKYGFSDIAILLRSRQLWPPVAEALSRSGIPFEALAETAIPMQGVVEIVMATLRIRQRSSEFLPGLRSLLTQFLNPEPELLQMVMQELGSVSEDNLIPLQSLQQGAHSARLAGCIEFVQKLNDLPAGTPISQIIKLIGSQSMIIDAADEGEAVRRIKQLTNLARPFEDRIPEFLDALVLQKEIDGLDERGDRVHLLTLHAAKGLEFPVVFVIGCEEGIIPYRLAAQEADIEEEQRLLYVGMTRAQQLLYITHAGNRMVFGQKHKQAPSRFLSAISESIIQRDRLDASMRIKAGKQLRLF